MSRHNRIRPQMGFPNVEETPHPEGTDTEPGPPPEPEVKVMVARAGDALLFSDSSLAIPTAKVVVDYHCDDHPELSWTRIIPRGDPLPQVFCSQCGIPMRGVLQT